ncbi:GntR family transcriptional regulator [Humitalea sp. 24SJ18S-53]|uniref:GntR family transcriptional regulator n=1 Tax=Humitalea sp. 24SJ18S-53 TaxID=3422307 RepID=UPI003D66FCCA
MANNNSDVTQTAATYDRLRTAILSLELLPGETISERYLEEVLSSSRTPIRAALARLESEGMVRRSGRGYIVAPIDVDELIHAYAFREVLECEAIRKAALIATDEDVVRLRSLATAAAGAPQRPAPGAELADAFHMEFARIYGNPFLIRALESTQRIVYRARWLEMSSDIQDAGAREHAVLVDLVAEHRADDAAVAMALHVSRSRERMIEMLKQQSRSLRGRGLRIVA